LLRPDVATFHWATSVLMSMWVNSSSAHSRNVSHSGHKRFCWGIHGIIQKNILQNCIKIFLRFFFFIFFQTGTCYVSQAGLKLAVFLPLPSKCCDYRLYITTLCLDFSFSKKFIPWNQMFHSLLLNLLIY
jgi:hypothetical protein